MTEQENAFTFHYVSINTQGASKGAVKFFPLHSTMFLLIPLPRPHLKGVLNNFTFHYVSINTSVRHPDNAREVPLHSTMFLLIPDGWRRIRCRCSALHSTMFLLIPEASAVVRYTTQNFTFHYVSINTNKSKFRLAPLSSLHSTMFLLIRWYHWVIDL